MEVSWVKQVMQVIWVILGNGIEPDNAGNGGKLGKAGNASKAGNVSNLGNTR